MKNVEENGKAGKMKKKSRKNWQEKNGRKKRGRKWREKEVEN